MLIVPEPLAATCQGLPERCAWLEQLPRVIRELQERWSLSLGTPFGGSEVSCAWVAPAVRRDGTRVVLKLGMPHMEGTHEIWDKLLGAMEKDRENPAKRVPVEEFHGFLRSERGSFHLADDGQDTGRPRPRKPIAGHARTFVDGTTAGERVAPTV